MTSGSATPRRRTPRYERLVNGRAVAINRSPRRCSHPECTTQLSRYNPDDTCNVHGGWTDESVPRRGRKPCADGGGDEGADPGVDAPAPATARRARSRE